jgi:site-specific recombinase XerD
MVELTPRREIPTPQLQFLSDLPEERSKQAAEPVEIRSLRIEEFLQARSLSPNSKKAYLQDLQRFLNWSDKSWGTVTRRDVALFKTHLINQNLAPATVNRSLTTLGNFFGWMLESDHVTKDPTTAIDLLPLPEPEAKDLSYEEVCRIYAIAQSRSHPERDIALISVLLHGLRAGEVSALDVGDFDKTRLHIRKGKSDSKGRVPLKAQAVNDLNRYITWRKERGEVIEASSPLFLSCSRRSRGSRLTYWGIRDVMDAIREATQIDLNAHRFRHTFATDLALRGIDSQHGMTLTRHKSPQSYKIYTKRAQQLAAERAFYEVVGEANPQDEASEPLTE